MVRKSVPYCPPGVFCLTPGVSIFLIFIVVVFLSGILFIRQSFTNNETVDIETKRFFNKDAYDQRPPPPVQIQLGLGGDDRYTRAPEPLKFAYTPPMIPVGGALPPPFGYATQGLPEKYQSYGFISTENGQTLPLYGRRLATRSDRFNYYTRTDTYNPIQLPIRFKGRDCQDSVGCEEVFNGDHVRLPNNLNGKISVYQSDGPPYIPYV